MACEKSATAGQQHGTATVAQKQLGSCKEARATSMVSSVCLRCDCAGFERPGGCCRPAATDHTLRSLDCCLVRHLTSKVLAQEDITQTEVSFCLTAPPLGELLQRQLTLECCCCPCRCHGNVGDWPSPHALTRRCCFATTGIQPPVAARRPRTLGTAAGEVIDDFHWCVARACSWLACWPHHQQC